MVGGGGIGGTAGRGTAGGGVAGSTCGSAICSPGEVWAVGTTNVDPTSAHWDGAKWTTVAVPIPSAPDPHSIILRQVWGFAHDDVWAVGQAEVGEGSDSKPVPAVLRFQGTSWTICKAGDACLVPAMTGLNAIFGLAADDLWVAGRDGAYHWNGQAWAKQSQGLLFGGSTSLQAIWCATPNDCWIVGGNGNAALAQHWNGTTWSSSNLASMVGDLEGIFGLSASDIWAVGDASNSPNIIHWDGQKWSSNYFVAGAAALRAMWGFSPTDVWAVGDNGFVARWNGLGWTGSSLGSTLHFSDIWGKSSHDLWAVGAGALLHFDGATWLSTTPAQTSDGVSLVSIWGP